MKRSHIIITSTIISAILISLISYKYGISQEYLRNQKIQSSQEQEEKKYSSTKQYSRDLIIDDVSWENINLRDVIEELRQKCRNSSIEFKDLQFELQDPNDISNKITLTDSRISLRDLLNKIAGQAGTKVIILYEESNIVMQINTNKVANKSQ